MTREEVIEKLNEAIKFAYSEADAEVCRMAIAALREQEELQERLDAALGAERMWCRKYHERITEPRWISVEEKLPEDDLPPDTDRVAIKVLTVTKHGTRRFVRELTRQRWWWKGVMQPWSWSKDARGVTHWMPLPEPPTEEEV